MRARGESGGSGVLRPPEKDSSAIAVLLLLAALAASSSIPALDFPVLQPPASMFRAHREKFLSKLPPGSIAVLRSAPERRFSHDTNYLYRQDSDFYYLTGFLEPDAVAVFRPAAPDGKRFVLFVRPHDSRRETYEGRRAGPEGAVAELGADEAFPSEEFWERLSRYDPARRSYSGYLEGPSSVLLSDGDDGEWAGRFDRALAEMRSRGAGPPTLVDARELTHEMRLVKDADEIALVRRAAEISARGHRLAMKAAAPGRYEFEVQQALDGYCLANGARRMAYPSIVGSGPNSVVLHWDRNDRLLRPGEVVLNDSGAEYGLYASDVTRTYPAGGRFRPEQRALYEIVLAAQKGAMARVRPGATHEEIEQTASRIQTEGLVRLGLLTGEVEALLRTRAHLRFTLHGVSHWVGLDVHDVGKYVWQGRSRVLEPGMVFTIEPGIYIPGNAPGVDPKWWNAGIRIEDVVLVTKEGFECLSCSAPKEIEDVEREVREGAGGPKTQ